MHRCISGSADAGHTVTAVMLISATRSTCSRLLPDICRRSARRILVTGILRQVAARHFLPQSYLAASRRNSSSLSVLDMSSSGARASAGSSSKYAGPVGLPPNDAKTGPKGEPMTPIPSATLVVLCPVSGGKEKETYATLVVQRSNRQGGSFRSAVVFPGGLLDLADEHAVAQQPAASSDASSLYLRSLQLCALRETFEETGLLLVPAGKDARHSRAIGHVEAGMSQEEWLAMRTEVHDDARAFAPFLSRVQGAIQQTSGSSALPTLAPLLHYSHWVTPRNMCRPAKRFDTHFFLTILDEADALGPLSSAAKAQSASGCESTAPGRDVSSMTADGSETTSLRLATPKELMQLAVKDDIVLYPPQYYILSDIASALDDESSRSGEGLDIPALRFGLTPETSAQQPPALPSSVPPRPQYDTVTAAEPMIQAAKGKTVPRDRIALKHRQDDGGMAEEIGVFPLALPGDVLRPLRGEAAHSIPVRLNRVYVTPRTKGDGGGLMVHGAHRRNMPGLRDFSYGASLPEIEDDSDESRDARPLTTKL